MLSPSPTPAHKSVTSGQGAGQTQFPAHFPRGRTPDQAPGQAGDKPAVAGTRIATTPRPVREWDECHSRRNRPAQGSQMLPRIAPGTGNAGWEARLVSNLGVEQGQGPQRRCARARKMPARLKYQGHKTPMRTMWRQDDAEQARHRFDADP